MTFALCGISMKRVMRSCSSTLWTPPMAHGALMIPPDNTEAGCLEQGAERKPWKNFVE